MVYVVILVVLLVIIPFLISRKPPSISLKGAHVLITGGSSGIGLALAKKCATRGAIVSIVARNGQKLQDAKEEIESHIQVQGEDQRVNCIVLDISVNPDVVKDTMMEAENKFGPVDFLFNCAGTTHPAKFEDISPEVFENLMKINYLGSVYCTLAVIPGMKLRKKGRVVFVSSQAGQLGLFGYTAYSASKFALRGLAESLQMEVKPYKVAITMAFPPDTDTPGFRVENKSKPEETIQISETSGIFTADAVAKKIISDCLKGEFVSVSGLEGALLAHVTAGMSPCNSYGTALLQAAMLGIFRIVGLVFLKKFDRIVENCCRNREV